MLIDLPWDDEQWRAQKAQRMDRLVGELASQLRTVEQIIQTYDKAPRRDWQMPATPCFGYWQSPGDPDGPMSNTADEWGL